MKILLVDNSNTRTKLTLTDGETLSPWLARIPTAELSIETLQHATHGQAFDAVLCCSVVPDKAIVIEQFAGSRPFHALSYRSKMPIRIDYPNPKQIGADRIANSIAVSELIGSPSIVVDFGTAVTFDVVEKDGVYVGGVIAPGLAAMTEYLSRRTALLPQIDLTEPEAAIGKSTVAAMQSGAVYGYRGLVKEIIARLSEEMSAPPKIVATGGDAALIAKGVPEIHRVDITLTLQGLRIAAKHNLLRK